VEGPTDDAAINAVRDQQKRNLLATLLLSHGTPMLLAGDEFGRSQMGNNNGYCQDSEISWVHWENLPDSAEELRDFVRQLTALRAAQPLLRRESWRDGMTVTWFNAGGGEQTEEHWQDDGGTTLGVHLAREDLKQIDGVWSDALVLFNPHDGPVPFTLPESPSGRWSYALTTAAVAETETGPDVQTVFELPARSLTLLHPA
jgi:glycogen operon protein